VGILDQFGYAAGYVDKVFRRAEPEELPVEPAARFELVIDLRTAEVLGLTIPPTALARADEIVE
jgi:putative ABC transport system substrate-binding protein